MRLNPLFQQLPKHYLFQRIHKETKKCKGSLLDLSIGDTSQPLAPTIVQELSERALELSSNQGYLGYGPAFGSQKLREAILKNFYPKQISSDEIFISDGAKCDIGRLQLLFDKQTRVAIQNPTYPVYQDTSLLHRDTPLVFLECLAENDFFPDIENAPPFDVLFFCSPNNPTGVAYSKKQLQCLVELAHKKGFLIVFDAAYSSFIQDPQIPKTLFEIEGADEIAIEIHSFSKSFGFTGLRLGWSVVPKKLKFQNGISIHSHWQRIVSTFFNGPSRLIECAGLAALSYDGMSFAKKQTAFYMKQAASLRETLTPFPSFGGVHAPYIWAQFPEGNSWESFHKLLDETGIISVPGSGFGSAGEGFLRFSAFSKDVSCAAPLLKNYCEHRSLAHV